MAVGGVKQSLYRESQLALGAVVGTRDLDLSSLRNMTCVKFTVYVCSRIGQARTLILRINQHRPSSRRSVLGELCAFTDQRAGWDCVGSEAQRSSSSILACSNPSHFTTGCGGYFGYQQSCCDRWQSRNLDPVPDTTSRT